MLLSYRIPRDPSTPRIAVWRKLRRLGVAKIGDGLVALPADDRTREHLQWVAVRVQEAGGDAIVWDADPASKSEDLRLRASMNAERDTEYRQLRDEVRASPQSDGRTVKRWRRTWRDIQRRDYFGSAEAEKVRAELAAITAAGTAGSERAER